MIQSAYNAEVTFAKDKKMALSPREQIASATMIATHEVVTSLTKAKDAMESLVHEMRDFTALITQEGRVVWGNKTAAQWLHVEHDHIHEHGVSRLFADDDWLRVVALTEELKNEGWGDREFALGVKRGTVTRDVLFNLRPFRGVSDRRGQLYLLVGRDITDVLEARTVRAKLEAELETAQLMQQAFFPPAHLATKGLEISSFYQPAEQCSGDWWGAFDLGFDTDLICIADVTGHGAASALVTAMTQAACLSFAKRNYQSAQPISPARLLTEINDIVCTTFKGGIYMTFFAVVIDHRNKVMRASNAAHNFPFVLRHDRRPGARNPEAIVVQGTLIGYALDTVFTEKASEVHAGDRLVLYTDGFVECRNPERKMYGAGNFRRSILKHAEKPLEEFRDALVDDAFTFFNGQPLIDDVTLVTFDVKKIS